MTTFVLVGGFWIGAWAWTEVAAQLAALGHRPLPIDLTGLGEKRHMARPDTGLETHIGDVVRYLDENDLTGVVLVGHSGAGAIINGAAERAPARIAGLIFVDSGPVPEGACIADFTGPKGRADTIRKAAYEGGGCRIPLPPWEEFGPAALVGMDEAKRAFFRANAADQPLRVATDPVRPMGRARPDLPRWAILCSIPLAEMNYLIVARHPWFAAMGGPEWSVLELPTGHWPMLSKPRRLAEIMAAWPKATVASSPASPAFAG